MTDFDSVERALEAIRAGNWSWWSTTPTARTKATWSWPPRR